MHTYFYAHLHDVYIYKFACYLALFATYFANVFIFSAFANLSFEVYVMLTIFWMIRFIII